MAKQYNPWTGFLEDTATKANDTSPVVGKKYTINGNEFKVLEVKGDNVKVLGSNGIVNHLNIKMLDKKSTIDKAIRNCDEEGERWITMNGSHVKIDGEGNAVAGNENVKSIINSGKSESKKESSEKQENKINSNLQWEVRGYKQRLVNKNPEETKKKYASRYDVLNEDGTIGGKYLGKDKDNKKNYEKQTKIANEAAKDIPEEDVKFADKYIQKALKSLFNTYNGKLDGSYKDNKIIHDVEKKLDEYMYRLSQRGTISGATLNGDLAYYAKKRLSAEANNIRSHMEDLSEDIYFGR